MISRNSTLRSSTGSHRTRILGRGPGILVQVKFLAKEARLHRYIPLSRLVSTAARDREEVVFLDLHWPLDLRDSRLDADRFTDSLRLR